MQMISQDIRLIIFLPYPLLGCPRASQKTFVVDPDIKQNFLVLYVHHANHLTYSRLTRQQLLGRMPNELCTKIR